MPKFSYVATDPSGSSVKGVLDAPSAVRAQNDLLGRNFAGVRVRERKSIGQIEITPKKLKPADLMVFSRQMAAFLRAGIPILDSLEMLTSDASNKRLQQMLVEVSDACAPARRSPTRWPCTRVVSHLLRGNPALGRAHRQPRRGARAARRLHRTGSRNHPSDQESRSMYPAVILAMSIGTVILLVTYVLPKFKDFFKSFDAKLPLPTRMLLGVGDFFTASGASLLAASLSRCSGVFLVVFLRTNAGKRARDKSSCSCPGDQGRHPLRRRRAVLPDPERDAEGRRTGP